MADVSASLGRFPQHTSPPTRIPRISRHMPCADCTRQASRENVHEELSRNVSSNSPADFEHLEESGMLGRRGDQRLATILAHQAGDCRHPDTVYRRAVEQHLISLSIRSVELMNDLDYENPYFEQHLDANIHVAYNGLEVRGITAFQQCHKDTKELHQGMHSSVVNATAIVDHDMLQATVVMSQAMSGYESSTRRMASILANWAWRSVTGNSQGGLWVYVRCQMVYGTPEFLA